MKTPKRNPDHDATRIVGAGMTALGVILLLPELLMIIDGGFSIRVTQCAVLVGLPLVIGGVRRLLDPESSRLESHRDLD